MNRMNVILFDEKSTSKYRKDAFENLQIDFARKYILFSIKLWNIGGSLTKNLVKNCSIIYINWRAWYINATSEASWIVSEVPAVRRFLNQTEYQLTLTSNDDSYDSNKIKDYMKITVDDSIIKYCSKINSTVVYSLEFTQFRKDEHFHLRLQVKIGNEEMNSTNNVLHCESFRLFYRENLKMKSLISSTIFIGLHFDQHYSLNKLSPFCMQRKLHRSLKSS